MTTRVTVWALVLVCVARTSVPAQAFMDGTGSPWYSADVGMQGKTLAQAAALRHEDVLVNGVPVIAGGKATNLLPGKVLRGPGHLR